MTVKGEKMTISITNWVARRKKGGKDYLFYPIALEMPGMGGKRGGATLYDRQSSGMEKVEEGFT